jgi:hypothetical protein
MTDSDQVGLAHEDTKATKTNQGDRSDCDGGTSTRFGRLRALRVFVGHPNSESVL